MDAASTRKESRRQRALQNFSILDTPSEPAFDGIVELASAICKTSIACICFADKNRQWIKAQVGLVSIPALGRDVLCDYLLLGPDDVMQVPDALLDERYGHHVLVVQDPHIRAFAAAPLIAAGVVVGAVCVMDTVPRMLEPSMVRGLQILAQQVVNLLELRHAVAQLKFVSDAQNHRQRQMEGYQKRYEDLNLILSEQSSIDPLTGLKSRRAFDGILNEESARTERSRSPLALAMIEVDFFKSFNDEFGRVAGDEVLQQVAFMLQSQARPYDHAASYGSEGFAIAFPDTGLEASLVVAERIRKAVQDHDWHHRTVTVSVGVATTTSAQGSMNLVERASRALEEAKRRGRNCVVYVGEER